MGIVYRATLSPSKQELVESWLPRQGWAAGRTVAGKLGEYRFDDPAGEVGVETILWQADDGAVLQTPLTYRAAPLAEAEDFLVGTSEHSVLGRRWVYDGCGDPVWVAAATAAILTGACQAQMYLEQDGERVDVPARIRVRGSGDAGAAVPGPAPVSSVTDQDAVTVVRAGDVELALARVVGRPVDGTATLTGRVGDAGETVVLAGLRRP